MLLKNHLKLRTVGKRVGRFTSRCGKAYCHRPLEMDDVNLIN